VLKEVDGPAIIPHIAESRSLKFPYEVWFRSLQKLLMDTATSEYLFCTHFVGEDAICNEIFAGSFAVIQEYTNAVLPNYFDAIGLLLMILLTNELKGMQLIMWSRRIASLHSYFDKNTLYYGHVSEWCLTCISVASGLLTPEHFRKMMFVHST